MDSRTQIKILGGATVVGLLLSLFNAEELRCHHNPNSWLLGDFLLVALAGAAFLLLSKRNRQIRIAIWTFFVLGSIFSIFWNLFGLFALFAAHFGPRPCVSGVNFLLGFVLCALIGYIYFLLVRKLCSSGSGGEPFLVRLKLFIQEDIRRVEEGPVHVTYTTENQPATFSIEPLLEEEIRRIGSHQELGHPKQGMAFNSGPNGSADPMTLLSDLKPQSTPPSNPPACAFCRAHLTPFDDVLTRSCGHSIHGRCFQKAREESEGCPACQPHD